MPSVNKTPTLGLNRWQGNEYFKREDLVSDNDLIDAAFAQDRANWEQKADLDENGKVPASQLPTITGLEIGETSTTAYRGDRGKMAYDHSQVAHAASNAQKNSDITKAEIEAKLTGAITSHTHAYASMVMSTSTPSTTLSANVLHCVYS